MHKFGEISNWLDSADFCFVSKKGYALGVSHGSKIKAALEPEWPLD